MQRFMVNACGLRTIRNRLFVIALSRDPTAGKERAAYD